MPEPSAGFLLDTHVWVWYLGGSPQLPSTLRTMIDSQRERIWLSPVSIWELGILVERGRMRLDAPLARWVEGAMDRFSVKDAALNREVGLATHAVNLAHRDPADRFLAATAQVYGLTLMTLDRHLTRARWLPTRSR